MATNESIARGDREVANASRVVVPTPVIAALETLFGKPAAAVRVIYAPLFVRLLHGRNTVATTRRNRIYLAIPGEEFLTDPTLMLHEYCHVLCQWNTGELTVARYLGELARNGYWKNRYEVEVRAFVRANIDRFEALLEGAP